MKRFRHESAQSIADASSILKNGDAVVIAGGTDLLGILKDDLLPDYPATIVDLKTAGTAKGITHEGGKLSIGALSTLSEIASDAEIRKYSPGLAEAAKNVATPSIRNMGTIGGNICQNVRCWFYRYPQDGGGRLVCMRKGGSECFAPQGDNRYHSIFGGMKCGSTPCTHDCPAGTDIPGYMEKMRQGDVGAAAEIILRYNPMPMITSRICPHPCQDNCNQTKHGECVGIHCVERTVGDYILEHADEFYAAPKHETGKKIAVVGAGPSGLACAYYMRKLGHDVTVFDKMEKAGGVLMYGIPHYRLPKSVVEAFTGALAKMGVKFEMGKTVGEDVSIEALEKSYDSFFFGTGAWKQPILGIHGEEMTQFGLNFLVEVNTYLKNVASFGDNVLVCGGGNVAMDVALTAVRMGAKSVTLACLEQESEMPASAEEIARAKEEGVVILNGRGLLRVIDKDGKVCGLETKKCVSVFDENHRFAPKYDESDTSVIASDCIILATGQRVDLDFLGDKYSSQIKSTRGLIEVDGETFKTKMPHVYGGGDAVTGPNIAIRAVKSGVAAAKAMNRELGCPSVTEHEKTERLSFDNELITVQTAAKPRELPVNERSLDKEDSASLSIKEAMAEAGRCMNCGCYAVNPSDIAPMLIAASAEIVTNERTIPAEEFCTSKLKTSDILNKGEIVTSIVLPDAQDGDVVHYDKFRVRDAIDFAIVSLSTVFHTRSGVIDKARIVLGGAAPVPIRLTAVEDYVTGKKVCEETAQQAAELAVTNAKPMAKNAYKVVEIKAMVKKAVMRLE